MAGRIRLGMLTPSSNTVLEPVTAAMLADVAGVTAHFSRFPVREISLGGSADGQFDPLPMLGAARLLADARVDAICWNGTSAAWLGLDRDRSLCAAISEETGIPATSAMLALDDILRRTRARTCGIVTPYLHEVQERIVQNFARDGVRCIAERHLDDRENFSFSEAPEATVERMVREVAEAKPDAVAIVCTNLDGAAAAARLEPEIGVPIYDSVAAALWGSLRAAGVDTACVRGWGGVFGKVR